MHNRFLAAGWKAPGSIFGAVAVTWAAFLLLGGVPLLCAVMYLAIAQPEVFQVYLQDPLDFSVLGFPRVLMFVLIMLNFVIAMIGLWGGTHLISEQKFKVLWTGHAAIRWPRLLAGLLLWMTLLGAYSFIQSLLAPGVIIASPDAHELPLWILPGLLLIPIQSAFEELALRGQLLQYISKFRPAQPWRAWLITSLIFALLHGFNMEIAEYGFMAMMLQYLMFGLFLGAFALMDEGLELAIGIHIGNNLFSLFFVGYTGSSIDTPSLFKQVSTSPANDFFGLILMFTITFIIFFGARPQRLRAIFTNQPDPQDL